MGRLNTNWDIYQQTRVNSQRCKICSAPEPIRKQIDLMVMREIRDADDEPFTYRQIVDWAAEHGLRISTASLSRHYKNHIRPSTTGMLQTLSMLESMSEATGSPLTLARVSANIILHKMVEMMDSVEPETWEAIAADPAMIMSFMQRGVTAARAVTQIEKIGQVVDVGLIADATAKKLEERGISADTVAMIRRDVLGMANG